MVSYIIMYNKTVLLKFRQILLFRYLLCVQLEHFKRLQECIRLLEMLISFLEFLTRKTKFFYKTCVSE